MTSPRNEAPQPPLLNIANILTLVRLVLIPVFIWLYWPDTPGRSTAAFFVFFLAAVTDKADGYLARSRGLITKFGTMADTIADKALIGAAMIMVSYHGYLWWWVTIVMLGRELFIFILKVTVARKQVISAGWGGKVKMVLQSFGTGTLILPWRSWLDGWPAEIFMWIGYICLAIALYYSLTSAWDYIRQAREIERG